MIRPRWLIGAALLTLARPVQAQVDSRQFWLSLIDIPLQVQAARSVGTTQGEIASALDALIQAKATPTDINQVFVTRTQVVRQNGPTGNFGAFVQSQLAQGKRGRDLADAIHREHELEKAGYSPNHPGIDSIYVNGHWLYRSDTYVVNGKSMKRKDVVLVNGYWVPRTDTIFTHGHWAVPADAEHGDAEHGDAEHGKAEHGDQGDQGEHGQAEKGKSDEHGKPVPPAQHGKPAGKGNPHKP